MKVKKLMKGLIAAALAVTMAITPITSSYAQEVTVTSGPSTYTFYDMPVAAFEVTGLGLDPYTYKRVANEEVKLTPLENTFILYCIRDYNFDTSENAWIHSQPGSSEWVCNSYINYSSGFRDSKPYIEANPNGCFTFMYERKEEDQSFGFLQDMNGTNMAFTEIYHADAPQSDAIYVTTVWDDDRDWEACFAAISRAFQAAGATIVQIPVADALARNNVIVSQNDAATQAADQSQAETQAQAEAQSQVVQNTTSTAQSTYTVERGDNLCKIAKKVYGDPNAWKIIYDANSNIIKSGYILFKGQVLVIPAR